MLRLAVLDVDSAVNDFDRPCCIEGAEAWTDDPVMDNATADCSDSHAEQSTGRTTIIRPGDAKEEGQGRGPRRSIENGRFRPISDRLNI